MSGSVNLHNVRKEKVDHNYFSQFLCVSYPSKQSLEIISFTAFHTQPQLGSNHGRHAFRQGITMVWQLDLAISLVLLMFSMKKQ